MSNAAPGSARHAAIPRPHSAVAGGGTRQCARCLGTAPRVQFYTSKGKCSHCRTCWPAYMRERYAAKRIELGLSYRPRHNTAAADLADKPVVTRKAFRVVIDPIAAAIFGGGK